MPSSFERASGGTFWCRYPSLVETLPMGVLLRPFHLTAIFSMMEVLPLIVLVVAGSYEGQRVDSSSLSCSTFELLARARVWECPHVLWCAAWRHRIRQCPCGSLFGLWVVSLAWRRLVRCLVFHPMGVEMLPARGMLDVLVSYWLSDGFMAS